MDPRYPGDDHGCKAGVPGQGGRHPGVCSMRQKNPRQIPPQSKSIIYLTILYSINQL